MPPTIDEISQELRDVTFQVNTAHERAEERDLVLKAHESVERVAARYKELLDGATEGEKLKIERQLGRRVVDLKRAASTLPRIAVTTTTPDRQAGASAVGERRITGLSWGAGNRAASGNAGLRVGADVEAWCGPCGGLTTHSIVALVNGEPKQVVCQSCNGRHGYRTAPARRTGAADGGSGGTASPASPSRGSEDERRASKKMDEQNALAREIAEAQEVRPFDAKERYKSGEIISHPEFGRGKVETVLRASMLVRFARGGLKSLMLV